jgi:ribosomal protein L11 methyltransferase
MNGKPKIWYLVEIETPSEAEEAVEFALNELDSLGTEINNLGKKQTRNLHIIGYFNELIGDEILRDKLNESLRIYGFSSDVVEKIEWREIENRDWLAEWKKHWRATETEKFIVAPPWETIERSDKIIIRIEPGMAFGTGTHETTRLCLKAIEEYYRSEMNFLDVGTGTGILAIAAAKIKDQRSKIKNQKSKFKVQDSDDKNLNIELENLNSIAACDIDEDSVKIARENAEINGVGGKIDFYLGSISEEIPQFDFVCANLTADVILPLLPLLLEKARKTLVLSGILIEQESLISKKLKEWGVSDFRIETDGEWISVKVEK